MISGSPAKKIKSSSSSSKRKFKAGNPLWPCPSIVCVPGLLKAEGAYVVKDWIDPPLHLHCAKCLWRAKVDEILASKQNLKDIGTTAQKESAQPSAPAIDL
ncbi:unnamed protein product [Pylaiella littoralis]